MEKVTEIRDKLLSMADEKYKEFQCTLMPTVDRDTVIGVRTPMLRELARELSRDKETEVFLNALPHRYYEENNLHAYIIEYTKDISLCYERIEKFLPYVDNWATCDGMCPRSIGRGKERLYINAKRWAESGKCYTARFGIKCFMSFFLGEWFSNEILEIVCNIKSGEYYVNMMRAWFFATALAKQYDATLPYIMGRRLDVFTHNKAIQKAIESYRVTEEHKAVLRKYTIK